MMTEKSIIEEGRYSGDVSWKDDKIEWQNHGDSNVTIMLNDVALIGEYTTDAGPFSDDWFLVFVYKSGCWDSISIYADGINELKQHLSEVFYTDLSKYFLADSADWRSCISYPQDLEGKSLFVVHPPNGYKPPTSLLRKLQSALGLGVYRKSWDLELTDEAKSKLQNDGD